MLILFGKQALSSGMHRPTPKTVNHSRQYLTATNTSDLNVHTGQQQRQRSKTTSDAEAALIRETEREVVSELDQALLLHRDTEEFLGVKARKSDLRHLSLNSPV